MFTILFLGIWAILGIIVYGGFCWFDGSVTIPEMLVVNAIAFLMASLILNALQLHLYKKKLRSIIKEVEEDN